eukprot:CAMPEP_0196726892 /NCGR_PEP_ID=MMETSP1091-20130531/8011_1 /TAXON_ID=302021 /ORGANISM="Rhodomonas sp., Strain CCMP768" /LENGTH=75 /DNA_ID=CAMNT_0042069385 /DNA_START=59 /DNA_END=286 /DNA_ORIENTATION=-
MSPGVQVCPAARATTISDLCVHAMTVGCSALPLLDAGDFDSDSRPLLRHLHQKQVADIRFPFLQAIGDCNGIIVE